MVTKGGELTMAHALVIGGTGMLKNVSLWLTKQGYHVSVIGRNEEKLYRLVETAPTAFTPLQVDYQDDERLRESITYTMKKNGPIHLVVAWIHGTAPHALDIINEQLEGIWRLVQIVGSRADLTQLKVTSNSSSYQQVQLGFIIEENHSRWLTHDEIAAGVIDAIVTGTEVTIVGNVTPVEKRPS